MHSSSIVIEQERLRGGGGLCSEEKKKKLSHVAKGNERNNSHPAFDVNLYIYIYTLFRKDKKDGETMVVGK